MNRCLDVAENRYETSVAIAKRFCNDPSEVAAVAYVKDNCITTGTALGGDGVPPDGTVKKIFGMTAADKISGERYE